MQLITNSPYHMHTKHIEHMALNIQCVLKVFTVLHFFHILLCDTLIPKWIQFKFFIKFLNIIPHNDNFKPLQIY